MLIACIVAVAGIVTALLASDVRVVTIGWCLFVMGGTVVLGGVGSVSWFKAKP